jgi:ribosomal protein S18 acetylase RimI-like enzyme
MPDAEPSTFVQRATIRSFEPHDQEAVSRLYTQGLLAGQIAPNDTGADIENIREAYFDDPRHHFWVAVVDDRVEGMIGVASDEPHTAEIRRLRVSPEFQSTDLGTMLLETAIAHCKRHGYLKVRLDTRFERTAALGMFDRAGFEHTRSRNVHGKELLEFYLDLYRKDEDASQA